MKVILLTGGKSKRLKPIADKNSLIFSGKPLMQWQIEALLRSGFDDFIIVTNLENEGFTRSLVSSLGINAKIVIQPDEIQGMAGGLVSCETVIGNEDVLIISGNDVVEDIAFKSVLGKQADVVILGYKVSEYFPGGYLTFDDQDNLLSIVEKPAQHQVPSDFVNIVVHYYASFSNLLERLKPRVSEKDDDAYEQALDSMIKGGLNVKVAKYDGFWQALKFPWHIPVLDKYFFDKRYNELLTDDSFLKKGEALVHKTATLAENTHLKGKVILEEGVKLFENSICGGPAYVGKSSIIGNNSLFRESFCGEKCVIGFSSEVARSHLGSSVWMHTNYAGDSIIGSNVSFGSGAVIANLRLDEKEIEYNGISTKSNKFGAVIGDNVRVGVQTSIMPGVSIGANSAIGSGVVLSEKIGENEFVYARTELVRKQNLIDIKSINRD